MIRPANASDVDEYRTLRLDMLQTNPDAFSGDYERTLNQPSETWLERLGLKDGSPTRLVFAEHEGRLVGMSGITRGESVKTRHGALLFSVYVRPEWRGQKLGAALVEACLDWARTQGVIVVRLGVNATNVSAIRCYANLGFSTYGLEPQFMRIGDTFYDLLLMTKNI